MMEKKVILGIPTNEHASKKSLILQASSDNSMASGQSDSSLSVKCINGTFVRHCLERHPVCWQATRRRPALESTCPLHRRQWHLRGL